MKRSEAENYLSLVEPGVYIPKYHRQFHVKSKSVGESRSARLKSIIANLPPSPQAIKKLRERKAKEERALEETFRVQTESDFKIDKRPLIGAVEARQKKYEAKNAALSKSPYLMSNYVSPSIYSSYRRNLNQELREHRVSPETVTEKMLGENPPQLKKYAFPQFDQVLRSLRSQSVGGTSRGSPEIASTVASSRDSPKLTKCTTPHRYPTSLFSGRCRVQSMGRVPQGDKLSLSALITANSCQEKSLDSDTVSSRQRCVITPSPHNMRLKTLLDEDEDSEQEEQRTVNTDCSRRKVANFFDLSELKFQNGDSSKQKRLLEKMDSKGLSLSQKQALSKEYEKAVKKDNLQDIQRFQRKFREFVSNLMASQNVLRPLGKPRGYLNNSLAMEEECPQNRRIFQDIVKKPFHTKLKQKEIAELLKVREKPDDPVITKVKSILDIPRLNPKSAHLVFGTILREHLASKRGASIFSLAQLHELSNSMQKLRQLMLHPVCLKFLKVYNIFTDEADSSRMLIMEGFSVIREEISRLEEEQCCCYSEGAISPPGERSPTAKRKFVWQKQRNNQLERFREAHLKQLVNIIQKCNENDGVASERIDMNHQVPEEVIIPRLSEKDKRMLFLLMASFLSERLSEEGSWEAVKRNTLPEEELVKISGRGNGLRLTARKKFKVGKFQQREEKSFREKMRDGLEAVTLHKTQLPPVAGLLHPRQGL